MYLSCIRFKNSITYQLSQTYINKEYIVGT